MKYAGESDPAAPAVKTYIAGWTGASGGALTATSKIRLDNNGDLLSLAHAMFRHEAGKPTPLLDSQIAFGINGERTNTLPKV